MKQIGILVLSVLALSLCTTNVPAATQMVDVVHLKNGSVTIYTMDSDKVRSRLLMICVQMLTSLRIL